MTPERWRRVREIFDSAVELPSTAAGDFIARACDSDAELAAEVHRMLEQHGRPSPLDHPPLRSVLTPTRSTAFSAGQVVAGRYRIVRYVNRGGMGEVYEAEDLDLQLAGSIALKTLLPETAADEASVARFKQEIVLSRRIAHPNVCKVFDIARHDSESGPVVFLSMEFLPGETLSAKLQREAPMPESEALPLLEQMAAALDASHAVGVIHRDFKPSNVMLVPSRAGLRVVVTDFGLARRHAGSEGTTSTITATLTGTLDYMAPELFTGSPASFASDIYALGMTTYKMVAGSPPTSAGDPLAAALARVHHPVPPPRSVQPALDERWDRAIVRSLDPKPVNRFASAAAFVYALRVETNSMTVRLPRFSRRRVILGTGAAALAGVASAWVYSARFAYRLPLEAQALYRQGRANIAAGAYFAATKALDEALKFAHGAAPILASLAEAWLELSLPEKAADFLLLAHREDLSRLPKLDRLFVEAVDRTATREYPAAAAIYETIARESGGTPEAEVDLGRAYEHAGEPDKAMACYLKAASGSDPNPAALLRLGVLYAQRANKAESEKFFTQAAQSYDRTSNLEGLTEVAIQQGFAATSRGELASGAAFLHKALDTARLAGNLQQEINSMLRLSTNAYLTGDTAAAEQYASQALDTARANQLDAFAIRGLISLGGVYRRKQDFAHAEQYYHDGLNLARQTHSSHLDALGLASLAALHDQLAEYQLSAPEAKQALAFYQANRYFKESAQCLIMIATAQQNAGEYDAARASLRGTLQAAEKAQDKYTMAMAHERIGGVLKDLTRYPEALEEYRQSLSLATPGEQSAYASLGCGSTLFLLGRFPEAAQALDLAAASGQKFLHLLLDVDLARSRMLLCQGQNKPAADLARASLAREGLTGTMQIGFHQVIGLSLVRAGSKAAGLKECEQARALRENAGEVYDAVIMIEAQIENGQVEAALTQYRQIEQKLPQFPEAQWRILAFLSHAEPSYLDPARQSLEKLARAWGDSAYNTYLMRPDINKLSRPLLSPVSASH